MGWVQDRTRVLGPREVDGQASGDEGEEGGPGPL